MAVSMLNRNFDLNITDFVSIGFLGLADLIDALGGLDLDLTREEVDYANQYVHDMHLESGTALEQLEWTPGTEHLTGIQSVAFCRIRYTQGDDYKRSSRQREVLSALLDRAKKAGFPGWKNAFQVFSQSGFISTSLSDGDLLWLVTKAMSMEIEDTKGLPDTDLRMTKIVDSQDCVIPMSLTDNVVRLHKFLYDAETYRPSETVEHISSRIRKDAGLSDKNGT
jgi:LCP family protein required for cell wall assembly